MPDPPALPARLTRMSTVVGVGSLLWVLAAVTALVVRAPGPVVVTCVVGAGLGGVGWAVYTWQRTAARRGSRTAQRGIEI